ncbi:MAG: hypothetical protein ACR2J8_01940, partial [Thermomicrobiales bacterium]
PNDCQSLRKPRAFLRQDGMPVMARAEESLFTWLWWNKPVDAAKTETVLTLRTNHYESSNARLRQHPERRTVGV